MKYWVILLSVFGIDRISKNWVQKKLSLGSRKEVWKDRLYFRHIKNKGMAYNTLEENPKAVLRMTGILMGIGFLQFLRLLHQKKSPALLTYLACMLGGALGNFWERANTGWVTDFLYIPFRKAPIFNVADIAIVLGGICTIPFAWLAERSNVKEM